MSKLEQFILISFGFLVFVVFSIRLGYFAGMPIEKYSIFQSAFLYTIVVLFFYSFSWDSFRKQLPKILTVLSFLLTLFVFGVLAYFLSFTYDTSWDGQGYHQTAVIALANGWNPVFDPSIDFSEVLPSQIFAEGYPSALWEVQATIYSFFGRINSAKVTNFYILAVSIPILYSLFRKLKISRVLSYLISLLIVLQPVFFIQMLSFMQDAFGYQLIVIAIASLLVVAVSATSYWAVYVFLLAEIMLVSTKYSHLPIALALGAIFFLILVNRLLNKEYLINISVKVGVVAFLMMSAVFFYLPYGRNLVFHMAMFYPTNYPDLMGSVAFNNIPLNLTEAGKWKLLFYGIFSESQKAESGDPRNEENVANLKVPFTFSQEEIENAASLYNNRVGSAGPLFSGIIVFSLALLFFASLRTQNQSERYAIYASYFILGMIVLLALLAPTPNLLRYVSQLQLVPFVASVSAFAVMKNRFIRGACVIVFILVFANSALYAGGVLSKNINEHVWMNREFFEMRSKNTEYEVNALQFYSNYILLSEQAIPFSISLELWCRNPRSLFSSSTTTRYCENS